MRMPARSHTMDHNVLTRRSFLGIAGALPLASALAARLRASSAK